MKKNFILVIILILIWGIYFWINYLNNLSRTKVNSDITIDFSKLNYNKIKGDSIEINNKKIIYTWTWKFEVDQKKIDTFIDELKTIKVLNIASTNKDNFTKFWIIKDGTFILIDNIKIFLWKNKWYFWEYYIKLDSEDKIYLIDKDLKNLISRDIEFFKKEEIKKEEIKKEEIKKEESGSWIINNTWTNIINNSWVIVK